MKKNALLLVLSFLGFAQISSGQASASKIPAEANEFKGHCYMLYTDTTKWDLAKLKCMQRGGHLAVISDPEENDFVYRMTKHHRAAWIGLSKTMDSWRWVTTSQNEFFNWAPGEPNVGKNEKSSKIGVGINVCIYGEWQNPYGRYNILEQSKWDDRFGDNQEVTGYICEWDKTK